MMMTTKAPVMFVSHGAPTYALEPEQAGNSLSLAKPYFSDVKAIILLSAHWITHGQEIMAAETPETIHDFGGFPEALYQIEYSAKGNANLAQRLQQILSGAGFEAKLNPTRGYDHGAWVPMMHLFPMANLPIVQISINHRLSNQALFELGKLLTPLRTEGIAIIGSGSLTHNLRDVGWGDHSPLPYVLNFQTDIRHRLQNRDFDSLVNHPDQINDFTKSHPTDDHYLPLVFVLGAVEEDDRLEILEGGIAYQALSMDSFLWHSPSEKNR